MAEWYEDTTRLVRPPSHGLDILHKGEKFRIRRKGMIALFDIYNMHSRKCTSGDCIVVITVKRDGMTCTSKTHRKGGTGS